MSRGLLPGLEVFYFLLFMLVLFLVQMAVRRLWQISLEGIWLICFAALATTFYFRVGINLLLLTGVCLGLLVVVCGLWLWQQRDALLIARHIPSEVQAQQPTTIVYRLTNRSRFWMAGLVLQDQALRGILPLPSQAAGPRSYAGRIGQQPEPRPTLAKWVFDFFTESEAAGGGPDAHPNQRPVPQFPHLRCFLRPGESLELEQPVLFTARGLYHLGPVQVWMRDPLGLHTLHTDRQVPDEVQVLPAWQVLESLPREMLSLQRMEEETTDEREGLSTEFRSIREYRPGDSLKSIHWGLTARHQQLMVRQYQHLVGEAWGLLLDLHEGVELGLGAKSDQERLISLAASLAGTLSASERPYALGLAMQHPVWLEPATAGLDHTAVLRLLAAVRFDRRSALELALQEARQAFPDRPWLILTTRAEEDLLAALSALKEIQPTPAAVVFDHSAQATALSEQERFMLNAGSRRQLNPERVAALLQEAESQGCRIYRVTPDEVLSAVFESGYQELPDWAGTTVFTS